MADEDEPYHMPSEDERVPASALHRHVEEVRLRLAEKHLMEEERAHEHERKAHFEFLNRRFTEADRVHVEQLTAHAVHVGKFEVEILRFPGAYLTDGGRAINNREPDWPQSLTGYAESLFHAYKDVSEPLGYRLVARILDYPNGMIGEVALVLEW